jgi:hypothetical protein
MNFGWGCYPRGCSDNDVDLIEQYQMAAQYPGAKVTTAMCTKVRFAPSNPFALSFLLQ